MKFYEHVYSMNLCRRFNYREQLVTSIVCILSFHEKLYYSLYFQKTGLQKIMLVCW